MHKVHVTTSNLVTVFTPKDHYMANLLAPRGVLIKHARHTNSMDLKLPETIMINLSPITVLPKDFNMLRLDFVGSRSGVRF